MSEIDADLQRAIDPDDARDARHEQAGRVSDPPPAMASQRALPRVTARANTHARTNTHARKRTRAREGLATKFQLWRLNELGLLEVRWDRVGEPVQKEHANRLLAQARAEGRW